MNGNWPQWAVPVLAYLAAKNLLIIPNVTPQASHPISIEEALRVGRELEPRVLEVLPAAVINYPGNFKNLESVPTELRCVIDAIKDGQAEGPSLDGIPYNAMKRWANIISR